MIGHGEGGINGVFQARPVEAQVSGPRLEEGGADREVMDNERGEKKKNTNALHCVATNSQAAVSFRYSGR